MRHGKLMEIGSSTMFNGFVGKDFRYPTDTNISQVNYVYIGTSSDKPCQELGKDLIYTIGESDMI